MIKAKCVYVCACVLWTDIAIKLTNPIFGINRRPSCTDSTLNEIISSYFCINISVNPYHVIMPEYDILCNSFPVSREKLG